MFLKKFRELVKHSKKPVNSQLLKWLELELDKIREHNYPEPYILLTEQGNILAEWDFKFSTVEVIFDYNNYSGSLYFFDKQNMIPYPVYNLSFDKDGWKILLNLIGQEWIK